MELAAAVASTGSDRGERAQNLLQLSYEPMLAWRLDGLIELWNAGAERLYGFAAADAVGRSSHELLQTKFPIAYADLRSRLCNDGQWSGELRHVCRNGNEIIVDSRMQLLSDGTVLEVNRDITERKRTEAALRDREQRLSWLASIVESSDDAIISKTLDGTITSWNVGAERIFGYTADEAIGQPITIIVPQDRLDEERAILARVRQGEQIDPLETVRQCKNGSLVPVSLTVSPVKDASGVIVGASKIARNITEQKRAQDKIEILAREAEHRCKNILANVQALIKLSRSDTGEDLKRVIEGRIRALANVHSLFAETRWLGAELSEIAAQELAPYSADEGRLRIEGPPLMLEPDAAQAVAMALHELATNAAKYGALSSINGRVELGWARAADGRLNVCWTETGGPPVQTPSRRGLGGRIIRQMIQQINGEARFDWRPEGLVCDISFPT